MTNDNHPLAMLSPGAHLDIFTDGASKNNPGPAGCVSAWNIDPSGGVTGVQF
jgi:hypothetical protein